MRSPLIAGQVVIHIPGGLGHITALKIGRDVVAVPSFSLFCSSVGAPAPVLRAMFYLLNPSFNNYSEKRDLVEPEHLVQSLGDGPIQLAQSAWHL